MDTNLSVALKQLALTLKKTVDESISSGTIQPEEEVYFKWKVDKFQYTDKGITESSAHGEYITKPSWLRAAHTLEESIKKSNEYRSALEQLVAVFGKNQEVRLQSNLRSFIWRLIYQFLDDSKFKEPDVDGVITTFLKDLREEPVKYGARVELQGVVLAPERIEIADGLTIRQPKIEDLEKEYPTTYPFMQTHLLPHPSAILNVEFLGRGGMNEMNEIQRKVEHAVAILGLFKVGSVKSASYSMYSDSITDIAGGTLTSGERYSALETYLIAHEDVPKLKKFWRKMSNSIPQSFYRSDTTKVDHVTISYNRYRDALLQNGIIERRIANAVMGMEGLFLKPEGMQELSYRLRIRISKLLGLLGYNSHEVKEMINDAYGIRSIFSHGGHLSYDKKKKVESKYKDIKNLLLPLLDYLRISIITMMLIPKEKDEFIDLIDDSLIDKGKEALLTSVISGMKEILS